MTPPPITTTSIAGDMLFLSGAHGALYQCEPGPRNRPVAPAGSRTTAKPRSSARLPQLKGGVGRVDELALNPLPSTGAPDRELQVVCDELALNAQPGRVSFR